MLTIRFSRVGRKNRPYYHVVVQEKTKAPTGKHVEVLGSYDPHQKKAVIKTERVKHWISQGVQISDTAYNLFVKENVIEGKKRAVKIEKPKIEEKPQEEAAQAPVEEQAKEEVAKEETPAA